MIPDIVPVNTWQGNGSSTTFDFDFLINGYEELLVLHTDSLGRQKVLKYNIDYTIDQIGEAQGSHITFPIKGSQYNVLGENEKIVLMLNIPIAQTFPFGTSSFLNLASLEFALDYIVRLIQMLSRKVDRSVKVDEGSDIKPEELIDSIRESEINSEKSADLASQKANEASNSADLARDWAIKMDGKVQDEDYSSKYYANQTKDKSEEAILDIEFSKQTALDNIESTKQNALESIENSRIEAVQDCEKEVEKAQGFARQAQSYAGLNYNVFCVNSGVVGSDGLPAFLKLEGNILKTVGSFDLTTAQGKTYTIVDELTKDVSGLTDGEYNIFINPETQEISLKNNKIHIDNIFPSDAAIGDYLLNVAKPPYDLEEKTASENLIGLKDVFAGSLTVSGGGKTLMNILKFNFPDFLLAAINRFGLIKTDNKTIINNKGIISVIKNLNFPLYNSGKMINIGWEGEWMGSSTEDKHYTVPDNGWCFLRFHNPNRSRDFTVSLYINNISTYAITRTEGSLELGNMFFPVNKGDVLRLHNDLGSNSVVFCNVTLSKFFPLNVDK